MESCANCSNSSCSSSQLGPARLALPSTIYSTTSFSLERLIIYGGAIYLLLKNGAGALLWDLTVKVASSTLGAVLISMRDKLKATLPESIYNALELLANLVDRFRAAMVVPDETCLDTQ